MPLIGNIPLNKEYEMLGGEKIIRKPMTNYEHRTRKGQIKVYIPRMDKLYYWSEKTRVIVCKRDRNE